MEGPRQFFLKGPMLSFKFGEVSLNGHSGQLLLQIHWHQTTPRTTKLCHGCGIVSNADPIASQQDRPMLQDGIVNLLRTSCGDVIIS